MILFSLFKLYLKVQQPNDCLKVALPKPTISPNYQQYSGASYLVFQAHLGLHQSIIHCPIFLMFLQKYSRVSIQLAMGPLIYTIEQNEHSIRQKSSPHFQLPAYLDHSIHLSKHIFLTQLVDLGYG